MASTKKLLFNLKDSENINIIQILKSFIYDDKELRVYSEGKVYKFKDIIIKFNEISNRFMTYRCKVDVSSRNWVEAEWQKESSLNTISVIEDRLIQVSENQPTDIENKVWYNVDKKMANGSTMATTMVKNGENEYEKIYTKSIVENVYMSESEDLSLKNKLAKDDIDINRLRSNSIIDVARILGDVEVFLTEKDTAYTKTVMPSDCVIDILHKKNKSIIIV